MLELVVYYQMLDLTSGHLLNNNDLSNSDIGLVELQDQTIL